MTTTPTPQDLLPLLTVSEAALHTATSRTMWGGCTDCHATFTAVLEPSDDADPDVRVYSVAIAHDPTCPWLAGIHAANAAVPTDSEEVETNVHHR